MGILTIIGRGLLLATALAQTCNAAAKAVGHPNSGNNNNIDVPSPSSTTKNLRRLGSVNHVSNDTGDSSGDSRDDDGQNTRICSTGRECNMQRLKMGLTKFYIGN